MRVVLLILVVALAACASNRPAPVVDRQTSSTGSAASVTTVSGYAVKRGDTVYSIARQHGVDPRDLMTWNQLSPSAPLSVGQVLRVKAPAETQNTAGLSANAAISNTVVEGKPLVPPAGASVASTAGTPPTPSPTQLPPPTSIGVLKTTPKALKLPYTEQNLAIIQRAETPSVAPAKSEEVPAGVPTGGDTVKSAGAVTDPSAVASNDGIEWSWPAAGNLNGRFGEGGNKGIEIAGRVGDPVYAAAGGKVTYSGAGVRGYGNLIIIKHNDKYLSAYAHNQNLLVKQWQVVKKGQKIAEMGASGTDSPKLHFEIRLLSKPVDPEAYLPARGG